MGRYKGKPHTKERVYLTEAQKEAICSEYSFAVANKLPLRQADLGVKYKVSQVAISKVLREAGVHTRTPKEAAPVTFDVDEAIRLYTKDKYTTIDDVAKKLGKAWSVVRNHLVDRGVPIKTDANYAFYECDRNFFSEVTPVTAYFAGFIAADGCIADSGRSVDFGLHPKDICMLESLKAFAKSEHPIRLRPNNFGKNYVWLRVCSVDWVKDLEKHYNIVPAKSLILKPPNLNDPSLIWHFIRGYFDGDGHSQKEGYSIVFTCGSSDFFDWLLKVFGAAPNTVQEHLYETDTRTEYISAKSAHYTGETMRFIIRSMYKDSTPQTRLERKFLRLKNREGSF